MLAQKCLKEADVTLAEDDYSDFELRLWDAEIAMDLPLFLLVFKEFFPKVPTPTLMDFAVQVGQKLGFDYI